MKDGKASTVQDYTDEKGEKWIPFSSESDLLKKGFVKLPETLGQYETEEKLFTEVRNFVAEYVNLSQDFLTVVALYILMTWVYDRFYTIPYLRVIGEFGTGKSRLLQVVGNLCYKGMLAGASTSTAVVFRTIDEVGGTFVFDEADFRYSNAWSEIVKILNSGHSKGSPVTRMKPSQKKEDFLTQSFEVYGPKVLASRERFGDEALESRCLTQHMSPSMEHRKPVHLDYAFERGAKEIQDKLLAFRFDNFQKVFADEKTLKEIRFPRLRQSALAMTSLASFVSSKVLDELLSYLQKYEKDMLANQRHDTKVDVLVCIIELVKEFVGKKIDKIYMKNIKARFEEKYYEEYSDIPDYKYESGEGILHSSRQQSVSARKIGGYVKRLGIPTDRDEDGYHIKISERYGLIERLAERYGFTDQLKEKRTGEINQDEIEF